MRYAMLMLFGLIGCPGDPVEVTEIVDTGALCRLPDGGIQVDFETCLSSSCDTLTDSTCTATLDGDVLTLASYARIESQGTACTDDCGFAMATCTLPAIADPSAVTVEHGTTSVALDAIAACPAI